MQLLMLSTGPFAVPTFRGLYETRHRVLALVTSPLRTHRGQQVAPVSRLREIASEHGTPVFDPEDVNTPEAQRRLAEYQADLLVVCDYGQILAPATLATTRLGGINLHGSLLPKYRGAAPINWAIYHGETETGATVIHITPEVDAGPCIAQVRVPVGPEDTAVEVEARLAEAGAALVREAIDLLESGQAKPLPQDAALASKAPRLKKTDGAIDWSRPAQAIRNQIRALEPWPKTYTFWLRPGAAPVRLILGPVNVVEEAEVAAAAGRPAPGTVLAASGGRLVVAAGQGAVAPRSIQPAGKKMLSVEEFLRGYHVRPGERFGPEE